MSGDKDLETLLLSSSVKRMERGKLIRFWPNRSLNSIMTEDNIAKELSKYTQTHAVDFRVQNLSYMAKQIASEYRQIFAILVLIGQGACINKIMGEKVKDIDLPLVGQTDMFTLHRNQGASRTHPRPVPCLANLNWGRIQREYFLNYQYAVSPIIMSLEADGYTPRHVDFDPNVILPFTEEGRDRQVGGFGQVRKVKIHKECHRFDNLLKYIQTGDYFAVKQLVKQDQQEFEKEVKMLKHFNGFTHAHLVTLLMTWTIHDQYHLLFPFADCDLIGYWESKPLPVLGQDMIRWISKQILGMVGALASIHNPPTNNLQVPQDQRFGKHGDLKPENILWYHSPTECEGILVIADLGLATLNSVLSRSNQPARNIQCTPRYKAPECDLEGATVSRSYDIWTLGCLLLELIIWAFQGNDVRKQFLEGLFSPYPTGSSIDVFFNIGVKDDGRHVVFVKPQVSEKIKELHESPHCSQFFHDLLYLIEEQMIITRSENVARISCPALHQRIRDMHAKVESQGGDYSLTRCLPPRPAIRYAPVDANFMLSVKGAVNQMRLEKYTGISRAGTSAQQLRRDGDY